MKILERETKPFETAPFPPSGSEPRKTLVRFLVQRTKVLSPSDDRWVIVNEVAAEGLVRWR